MSGSAVLLCGTGREAGAAEAAVVRSCSCHICAEVQTADQVSGEQGPHHTQSQGDCLGNEIKPVFPEQLHSLLRFLDRNMLCRGKIPFKDLLIGLLS